MEPWPFICWIWNEKYGDLPKLRTVSLSGISLVCTRYSVEALRRIYRTVAIPAIGGDDKLSYLLFMEAHVVSDSSSSGLLATHVPAFLTLQRMTSGPYATVTTSQRRMVNNLVNSCPKCLKKNQLGRPYQHTPKDPRILQFLDCEYPLYFAVAVDLFTEVYVLNHMKDRRKPTYPIAILAASCLISQDVSFYILDGATTKHVIQGFQEMTWRFRCPGFIIADRASQFVSLANNSDLLEQLSSNNINFKVLGAREAFASDFERTWKSVKKIIKNLQPSNSSLYTPIHTIIELNRKLSLASYLMSFRPFFSKNPNLLIYPRLFTHLHTNPLHATDDLLTVLTRLQEGVLARLPGSRADTMMNFRSALLDYLKSSAVRFKPEIQGEENKRGTSGLYPMVGDIVIYNDHAGLPRFGVITKVFGKNKVNVKTRHFKLIEEKEMHVKKVSLIYRKCENEGHFPKHLDKRNDQYIDSMMKEGLSVDEFLSCI